jgi:putative aminopeptidase FrvX
MTKESLTFLYEYMNSSAPTGHEKEGQLVWQRYVSKYVDEVSSDVYGTAYGVINPGQKFKVLIEAHADEISWYVNYITDDGFIHVIRNGGSDHMIAPSMRVNIFTPKGIVKGVFGWPAIHTRHGKNDNLTPKMDNIFVDIGAKDKKEVLARGVHVGCVITFVDAFDELNDEFFYGRALDNRIGGFCIAEVARTVYKNRAKLPFSLYIVNSVQEEIGLKGAEMIAQTLKPDVAIITDVTHDSHTPLVSKVENGDQTCGAGPVLTYAPSVHNKLLELMKQTADKAKIKYQLSAASRSTGTDTDSFAYANGGIPSMLVSLPLRYMHTTVEMVHKKDIENAIKLIAEFILKFSPEFNFKYF